MSHILKGGDNCCDWMCVRLSVCVCVLKKEACSMVLFSHTVQKVLAFRQIKLALPPGASLLCSQGFGEGVLVVGILCPCVSQIIHDIFGPKSNKTGLMFFGNGQCHL